MNAHRISHNRQGVEKSTRRFRPCLPDEIERGTLLNPHRYETNYQILKEFNEHFGVVCAQDHRLRIFFNPTKSAVPEATYVDMRAPRTSTRKKKTRKVLGKLGEYIAALIVSIISGIIVWRITAWLRKRGKGGDDADGSMSDEHLTGRQAYERSGRVHLQKEANDVAVPRVQPARTTKEVTLVKKHSSEVMLPQVKHALHEGHEEVEWGTLIARIVDARFKGTYDQRTRAAECYLQESFGLGLDDLLARAPVRTWYFMSNRFTRGSTVANWLRSALAFFGFHEKKLPLTGFDVFRIMSRRTDGGIGLGINDALQIALLWALKETRVAVQAKPSHETSDDFIQLASAFRGGHFIQRRGATSLEELISRINFQLRNGCRFVHEHAIIAHLARYLNDEWDDGRLTFIIEDMLRNADYLRMARDLEHHDFIGLTGVESSDDIRLREIQFVVSIQKATAAKLKYMAIVEDVYDRALTAKDILEEAHCNIIEALQWFSNSGVVFKTYRAYIKDVAKDIGRALDALGRPDDGSANSGGTAPADTGNNIMGSIGTGTALPSTATLINRPLSVPNLVATPVRMI